MSQVVVLEKLEETSSSWSPNTLHLKGAQVLFFILEVIRFQFLKDSQATEV